MEHLTLLDVAPPEFVTLAAGAGFDAVGLRIAPVSLGEESWPMSPGSPMLAETRRRCADAGVTVHAVEAIVIRPGAGALRFTQDKLAMRERLTALERDDTGDVTPTEAPTWSSVGVTWPSTPPPKAPSVCWPAAWSS